VRAECVEFMTSQAEYTVDYCSRLKKETTWGTSTEVKALSLYFKRPIEIYNIK
jgi:hypothetical protein